MAPGEPGDRGDANYVPAQGFNILRLTLLVFTVNLISAVLFIHFINRPVYDDPYNIFDVHNYAQNGFSAATLQNHRNPPGPTSFLWMAGVVSLLKGNELRDARIGTLLSWILLTAGIVAGAHFSRFRETWYGALLVLLVFPHTLEAMATVLTEGPALFFACMGALAWAEFVSRRVADPAMAVVAILGGLSMGLAVTCRQYNLALLPAAGVLAFHEFWKAEFHGVLKWTTATVSLAMAAVPVAALVLAWKGLSSPGMATGTSYHNMWHAGIGFSFSRPIIAAFYAMLYLTPFTFPVILTVTKPHRKIMIAIAVLGGIAASLFISSLLQPGPLQSVIRFASRLPRLGYAVFFLITMTAIYNALAVGLVLWRRRAPVLASAPLVLALLIVFFFVAEQVGVGGNIPFYDRYVLQIAPFLGIIAFSILPKLDRPRVFVLLILSVFSHFMLWRYAVAA